jgi:ferrous iron transport protein B
MLSKVLSAINLTASRCDREAETEEARGPKVALVGSPNVGKSVMFSNLTGTYVTVSNYPGTTVEVSRGSGAVGEEDYEVVDTPGMYSMLPLSEEEGVARRILLEEHPDAVIHVVDAKNLERMLLLTFQLIEAGFPVVLALNMMDEARRHGLRVDARALEEEIGIPVVPAVSTTGEGMDELRRRVQEADRSGPPDAYRYAPTRGVDFEKKIRRIEDLLTAEYSISQRCVALLLLQDDEESIERVQRKDADAWPEIKEVVSEVRSLATRPVEYLLTVQRKKWAQAITDRVLHQEEERGEGWAERLNGLLVNPLTGVPILLAVLYFALYRFVGVFGAGTAVDFLEGVVFEEWLNPPLISAVEAVVPWQVLQNLFVGEYGVLTLGLRYAVAIILPVVTFFFLVFSLIEDVGYLPRLALLLDRLFKKIGLSGRAVIPMVLGFGCDTMATMVTRTLSSKRERLIAVLLLSVAVPCSAQLGVIMALLSTVPGALLIWALVMLTIYVAVGTVAAGVIPGRAEPFYVEIPPLRMPKLSNVLTKTFARVKWYFWEVIPLFALASVLIWLGQLTGLFGLAISILEYPVRWIGLPAEASEAFLFGFFRRDYGVAGLYDLQKSGGFSGAQLLVGAIALTLFLPCIAQFLMTVKEKGWKTGLVISGTVLAISFTAALVVARMLSLLGARI